MPIGLVLASLAGAGVALADDGTAPTLASKVETTDPAIYARIRDEALNRSHVMDYATMLADRFGARLTGSPNLAAASLWARDQLTMLGADARIEPWGEFGLGWQRRDVAVRMVAPDAMPVIAEAAPWSPATPGVVSGEAIQVSVTSAADFDRYRGKLAGKIVLLGLGRDVPPPQGELFQRYTDDELGELARYDPATAKDAAPLDPKIIVESFKVTAFFESVGSFLAAERAAAVLRQANDTQMGNGSGGILSVDGNDALGWFAYERGHAMQIPVAVVAAEHYGRIDRLLSQSVPVSIAVNIDTVTHGGRVPGKNVIAEIRGTDPGLSDEIVMFGAHLDSWAGATGATDNGAGVAIALEVVRILKTLPAPRRTIRVALWTGEEQGLLGSRAYAAKHFGAVPTSTAPEQLLVPEFMRRTTGQPELKPGAAKVSAYFNFDGGGGKVRGISVDGNRSVAPVFQAWLAPLADLGATTVTLRRGLPGDQSSFAQLGIPAFEFLQDRLDYFTRSVHTNMDLAERLQPDDLKQAALVEAVFVYNSAMRDALLPRKPLPSAH